MHKMTQKSINFVCPGARILERYSDATLDVHLHFLRIAAGVEIAVREADEWCAIAQRFPSTLPPNTLGKEFLVFDPEHQELFSKGIGWQGAGEPLRDGTPFVSFTDSDFYPRRDPEKMEVHIKSGIRVTFQDSSTGTDEIDALLSHLVHFVKNQIVPRFEPFF